MFFSFRLGQIRSCRQWICMENELTKKLQIVQNEKQILKNSLAENLEEVGECDIQPLILYFYF